MSGWDHFLILWCTALTASHVVVMLRVRDILRRFNEAKKILEET